MVRLTASAEIATTPERASELIADPKIVERWLRNATGVRADKEWPRFNSQLSWELGRRGDDVCEARVVDYNLPDYLKVEVSTPTTNKLVIHKFSRLPNGNTLYEKSVDAEPKGLLRFLGGLGLRRVRSEIQGEVTRAAACIPADPVQERRAAKAARKAAKASVR